MRRRSPGLRGRGGGVQDFRLLTVADLALYNAFIFVLECSNLFDDTLREMACWL